MTTRRDLVKIAAALGFAGTVPTTAERIAAAQVLDQDVSSRVMLDPGKFAREIHLSTGNGEIGNDWYGVLCPEESADYSQARTKLERVAESTGVNLYRTVDDYDAAATSLYLAMYDAGLRHGAAYEHLRRSLVGETVTCTACWSTGMTYDEGTGKTHRNTICKTCGGTGTVAMKA
jgi:hypothetical protein